MTARRGLFAALLAVLAAAAPAHGQTVEVAVDGVVRQVPVLERQGQRFVSLANVARLLGGRVETLGAERAALVVDDQRLVVRRRVPYVEVEGRWYQLVQPAQKDATGFYVPASVLNNVLPVLWPGRFPPPVSTSAAPRPLPATDLDRIDVRVDPDRTRLSFRLARTPNLTVDDGQPGTLRIQIAGTAIPSEVARGLRGVGLVDSVAVTPASGGSGLTLWLDPRTSVYAVAPLRRPTGFEVVLRSGTAEQTSIRLASDVEVTPSERPRLAGIGAGAVLVTESDRPDREPTMEPVAYPPPERSDAPAIRPVAGSESPPPAPRSGWRVVIDAGHGGRDPGAIGPKGTREKVVTLHVARALAERLKEDGVQVVLTREGDEFVPLAERTRIANRQGADLFVSIHANSSERRSTEGFETYFLSVAKTEDARRVARMENAAIRYENPEIDPASLDELNFILRDLAQNEHLRESSSLAETIQEELGRRLALESRGVKQAGFFVLNGAFMPAVLFEMAFISNPGEEALLNDPAFRSRLVDGLADGLLAYLDGYGRRLAAR